MTGGLLSPYPAIEHFRCKEIYTTGRHEPPLVGRDKLHGEQVCFAVEDTNRVNRQGCFCWTPKEECITLGGPNEDQPFIHPPSGTPNPLEMFLPQAGGREKEKYYVYFL